jgi:hypothetical protein
VFLCINNVKLYDFVRTGYFLDEFEQRIYFKDIYSVFGRYDYTFLDSGIDCNVFDKKVMNIFFCVWIVILREKIGLRGINIRFFWYRTKEV